MPVVTRLHEDRNGRVGVELDGVPWRLLPVDVVVRSGLTEGKPLDRPALRTVRRELRRAEALAVAARALRARDLSGSELKQRLEQRGVEKPAIEESLASLESAGLVDDVRFASSRAASMAARGYGDAAIRHDLSRRGVSADVVERALEGLEPEDERASRIAGERGRGARTARYLAGRGFGSDAVEAAAGPDLGHDA